MEHHNDVEHVAGAILLVCCGGNAAIFKVDDSGNMLWSQTYVMWDPAYTNGAFGAITKTSDGGYAMTGQVGYSITGNWDFWLVKVDSNGNKQWDQTWGAGSQDYAGGVIQTSDGGYAVIAVTGWWLDVPRHLVNVSARARCSSMTSGGAQMELM